MKKFIVLILGLLLMLPIFIACEEDNIENPPDLPPYESMANEKDKNKNNKNKKKNKKNKKKNKKKKNTHIGFMLL